MATKTPKPDSTVGTRKKGRWKKGESGNPSGRPIENPARQLLMQNAEALTTKAIELALAGDTAALNACLARITPPLRGQAAPIRIDAMPVDLAAAGQRLLEAVASGELAPDTGAQLMQSLGTLARVKELVELEQRLTELERSLEK